MAVYRKELLDRLQSCLEDGIHPLARAALSLSITSGLLLTFSAFLHKDVAETLQERIIALQYFMKNIADKFKQIVEQTSYSNIISTTAIQSLNHFVNDEISIDMLQDNELDWSYEKLVNYYNSISSVKLKVQSIAHTVDMKHVEKLEKENSGLRTVVKEMHKKMSEMKEMMKIMMQMMNQNSSQKEEKNKSTSSVTTSDSESGSTPSFFRRVICTTRFHRAQKCQRTPFAEISIGN